MKDQKEFLNIMQPIDGISFASRMTGVYLPEGSGSLLSQSVFIINIPHVYSYITLVAIILVLRIRQMNGFSN